MARGIPSRRRQISMTAPASSAWSSEKRGATLRVRSTNRLTAASRCPRRRPARAPATVARRRRPILPGRWPESPRSADCARMASTRSAAASRTCSQLSNTNSRTRPSSAAATDSLTLLPGCSVMPSTAGTTSGTATGSATAANSKTQTPSGNSSTRRAATSSTRRVLPTPPTPISVTSRWVRSAACTSATSCPRPMKLLTAGRKLPGLASSARTPGDSVRMPGART